MKKALIVGLNEYPRCSLNWFDNDAVAIKDLIESNGDGSPNFDIKLIIDKCTKGIAEERTFPWTRCEVSHKTQNSCVPSSQPNRSFPGDIRRFY